MLTLERLAHPRRRRRSPRPRTIAPSAVEPAEPPSHILRPRVEDLGATWSAHARRCRRELPDELDWAALLLDPEQPLAVLCRREQACQLIVWHHHLPTCEQVSFSCERLAHGTQASERR